VDKPKTTDPKLQFSVEMTPHMMELFRDETRVGAGSKSYGALPPYNTRGDGKSFSGRSMLRSLITPAWVLDKIKVKYCTRTSAVGTDCCRQYCGDARRQLQSREWTDCLAPREEPSFTRQVPKLTPLGNNQIPCMIMPY
jgi:hypothetical protein